MWDCQYHDPVKDYCRRRKTICYPGGFACVLRGKFDFPLRKDEDPLAVSRNKRRRRK